MPKLEHSGVNWDLFVEFILSLMGESRFTQDTPIRPEVWAAFVCEPTYEESADREPARHDLILTPHFKSDPAKLAAKLAAFLKESRIPGALANAELSTLRTDIAAKLTFPEVVEFVLPMTNWWRERIADPVGASQTTRKAGASDTLDQIFSQLIGLGGNPNILQHMRSSADRDKWQALFLILLVSYARRGGKNSGKQIDELLRTARQRPLTLNDCRFLWPENADQWIEHIKKASARAQESSESIWGVSLNRRLSLSTRVSRITVKADAAERVFDIDTSDVTWAIIDSGIDAEHPAFLDRLREKEAGKIRGKIKPELSRVVRTYDFTLLRKLLSWGVDMDAIRADPQLCHVSEDDLVRFDSIKKDAENGRILDWDTLEPLLRMPHHPIEIEEDTKSAKRGPRRKKKTKKSFYRAPKNAHGTHVAGIIGADVRQKELADNLPIRIEEDFKGLCPKIKLIDFRVCDEDGAGEEFITIAAMQFVSYLNRNRDLQIVHGVNLSLSFQHEVANYACGQTPVCIQAERLVNDGVIVVAAAGNRGYQKVATDNGIARNFAAMSISDPGNAESIITVGATHKEAPHAYGVSYFSSRGPTGDGRFKPDLLAPGEKICAPIPGGRVDLMDGTSMAAPHVSAAAAMLIARHKELRANPRRVKEILCKTATCMGRDRYFQGSGLLDILRALQSV